MRNFPGMGERRDGNMSDKAYDNGIRLNLQMIADPMDEMVWEFTMHRGREMPTLRGCLLYFGQTQLRKDMLYLIQDGMEQGFPADSCCYVTTGGLKGEAPHIRGLRRPFPEVFNQVMFTFQRYHDFEVRINNAISGGGDLTELCRIGSDFFRNPVYVHDNLFSVIASSGHVPGMLELEYNEKTGKTYIPLWLINEFKFEKSYQHTLTLHEAGIWGIDQYPHNMRSLFVNLYDGEHYRGRMLINEIGTSLQPGQFRAAEFLGHYMIVLMRNLEQNRNHHFHNYEETLIDLITRGKTDPRDLQIMLNILGWKLDDRFLCLKLQTQDRTLSIQSGGAITNWLTNVLKDCVDFQYQQQLCVVVNLTRTELHPLEVRQYLAPLIRDSYMYGGLSCAVAGINRLREGFIQADIALEYITQQDSRNWVVDFPSCALAYISRRACQEIPGEMMAHPALIELREYDKDNGTQYYDTLRMYLICERSIPRTSGELIIHRTTLTYRLGKIQELVKLNLEDPGLRLYLQFSFHLLDEKNGEV